MPAKTIATAVPPPTPIFRKRSELLIQNFVSGNIITAVASLFRGNWAKIFGCLGELESQTASPLPKKR